ncbi:MAG: PAS domain S-box protein [Chloroflexota bacterium]|nr:PAS domain S-box protein [Dehalococcoidia bacterium]MDW8255118.1 PAS domain S-box protein [Chloroflexota bacterium]
MRSQDLAVYRCLFAALPLATLLVSENDLRIVDANAAAERFIGLPLSALVGQSALHFAPPDDQAAFASQLRLPRETPLRVGRLRDRNGEERTVAVRVARLDSAAEPLLLVVFDDVTDQLARAISRNRAVERQQLIAAIAGDTSWDWNILTGDLWWDDAVERLFGYPRGAIEETFAWWAQRVHPDDRARVEQSLEEAIAGSSERWEAEYRFRHADGHYVDVRDRGAIIRNAAGQAVRMVGSMMDISEHRRIMRALEESETRYRTIFEQAPIGVAEIDIYGNIVRTNAAFKKLFGISEHRKRNRHLISLFTHEDQKRIRSAVIRAQKRRIPYLRREAKCQRNDGSTFWASINAVVIFEDNGTPLFGIVLIEDISEQKEAEHRAQLVAQAEKLRALGQMASGVAHNVNQTLGLIAGHSQLALAALDQPEPSLARARESVMVIRQAVEEGAAVVRRLQSFARPGAEGPPRLIEVGTLLEDVARLTAPQWRDLPQQEGRPIRLAVNAEPGVFVEGWPEALHEALLNLIFNAVDALPQGGEIVLTAYRDENEAVIEVRDTGIGIPESALGRIFEPFFTTKGERGTGIGLPTVFRIIERHRGTIAVRSKVGAGTAFTIRLPSKPPATTLPRRERAERGPTKRILVVDDDLRIAEMARRMLELDDHAVTIASSGEEALRCLEREAFDTVIADLGLGAGMNGWDLAAAVRRRWPGTRFVLATGWGAELDPAKAQARGVDAVVAKPYTVAELRRHLAH